MSRRTQIVVGLVLASVLLWLFLRQADLGEVLASMREADYRWVLGSAALGLVTMVQRAERWRYLLRPLKSIRLAPLLACTLMGWAVTALFPGRLGEVARPVLIGRREQISKTAAFATIVLERVFDLLTVLSILAIYLAFFPLPEALGSEGRAVIAALRVSGVAALAAAGVGIGVIVAVQVWPHESEAFLTRFVGLLPRRLGERLFPVARSFITGFAGIRHPRLLGAILLHSALMWAIILLQYLALFRAFGLQVPSYSVLPLVVIIVIGVMVPTPGAVGSFHKAAQIGLATLWGVPNDLAVSYAIVSHAVAFVPVAVIGGLLLSREGVSLASVQKLRSDEPDRSGPTPDDSTARQPPG